MKKLILILIVFLIGTVNHNANAQCPVIVENALDCEIDLDLKMFDCNGLLIETIHHHILPGNWTYPKIDTVYGTSAHWCKCALQGACYKYKVYYNGADITGQILCCPQCDPHTQQCVKACCAQFDMECKGGEVHFTSGKPTCCYPTPPNCP